MSSSSLNHDKDGGGGNDDDDAVEAVGTTTTVLTGRIARKKKRKQGIELAIREIIIKNCDDDDDGEEEEAAAAAATKAANNDNDTNNSTTIPTTTTPPPKEQPSKQPPLVMCIIKNDVSLLVRHPVFIQLDALVRVTYVPDSTLWCSLRITSLELIECPGEPKAVQQILKEPDLWYSLRPTTTTTNSANSSIDDGLKEEEETETLDFHNIKNQHYLVRQIVGRLQRRNIHKETPRERPPIVKFRTIQALEELEKTIPLVDITWNNANDMGLVCLPTNNNKNGDTAAGGGGGDWNLPLGGSIELKSHHHKLTRQEYLQRKKFPQIGWTLTRLKQMRQSQPQQAQSQAQQSQPQSQHPQNENQASSWSWNFRHVLDVGGGRGDIAIQIAQTFIDCHVTVIDLNETSLEAGKAFANKQGVGDRMHWICQDFRDYCYGGEDTRTPPPPTTEISSSCSTPPPPTTTTTTAQPPPMIDLVIAWHACGDLSDLALQIGIDMKAAVMVCPCCYSKITTKTKTTTTTTTTTSTSTIASSAQQQPQQEGQGQAGQQRDISVATNLAELQGRPDLSRRGMHIINSLRYQNLINHGYHHVSLEEYTTEWSGRNQVLIAYPPPPAEPSK